MAARFRPAPRPAFRLELALYSPLTWRNNRCVLGVIILACVAVHSAISHTYTILHKAKGIVGALISAECPAHAERSGFNALLLTGAS